MTLKEFKKYPFTAKTEVKVGGKWFKIWQVDFGKKLVLLYFLSKKREIVVVIYPEIIEEIKN